MQFVGHDVSGRWNSIYHGNRQTNGTWRDPIGPRANEVAMRRLRLARRRRAIERRRAVRAMSDPRGRRPIPEIANRILSYL